MDEIDAVPRSRRQRPKDSFQNELQAKLKKRQTQGLSADITDSEDDLSQTTGFMKRESGRPSAAKRRTDASPDLSRGLGTTTMRSRDLSSLMGRSISDDEDEEIKAANLGKARPGGTWTPGIHKTPSPDSIYSRKTPTRDSPKDGRLESLYGRKTPTKDISPRSGSLSKEDIIFGRKTPVDGKKSPSDGKKSTLDGKGKLPGFDGDKPWQPPNFRSASPGSSEHSRGSRGVTPVDSNLDTISETPREAVTPRIQRGQRPELSPKLDERPKPHARSRGEERKTPPLVDPRRTPPSLKTAQDGSLKRASPSLDLFGKSRISSAQEVDSYISKEKDDRNLKYGTGKQSLRRSPSPDSKKQDYRSPGGQARNSTDGRKTSTAGDRQTPTSFSRKTPTDFDRKTPTNYGRKSPTDFDRKTPTGFDRKAGLREKKGHTDEDILREQAAAQKGSSLLDFLTEGSGAAKPKPQTRKIRSQADDDLDDIFAANRKILGKDYKDQSNDTKKSLEGRKSTRQQGRKSPEISGRSGLSAADIGEEPLPKTIPKPRPEDTSSVCEEIPMDPNRKIEADAAKAVKLGKQSSERAKADAAIATIAGAQTMQFIKPAKTMRPVTAHAKVEHRPKPRYGILPGETKTLQERQFNSTGDIRDAIYEEWYNERLKSARIKKKEEERLKKEKEEKENKEKKDKRLEAEASYRAWMEQKKEVILSNEEKKRRQEKEKLRKEEQERLEKKVESEKTFHHWKEKKDEKIKRELRKKAEEEKRKKEDEEYEKRMKNKDRETAFKGWQRKKENEWTTQLKEKKNLQKTKKQLDNEEKEKERQKEQDALDRYYDWMEQKEKQSRLEKKREKQRRLMGEDEYKPAWSPASRTIPFGS